MNESTYTAEIKVTKAVPGKEEKDRYGTITYKTPETEARIGHVTLISNDLDDLRARVSKVMEQVTD